MKTIFFILLLLFSCNGGSNNNNNLVDEAKPTLKDVIFSKYFFSGLDETNIYQEGDKVNLAITVVDRDFDISDLVVSMTYPDNPATAFIYFEKQVELPAQENEEMDYFLDEVFEVKTPSGLWLTCVFIIDKAGNESEESCFKIRITDKHNKRRFK